MDAVQYRVPHGFPSENGIIKMFGPGHPRLDVMPKILVIRLSSLGDVVLTAPVYKSLKSHWPDCSISVLVKPQFAAAIEGNPYVAEVISYRGLWAALRTIRGSGFTHLLDLHDNLRSRLIRALSRIERVSVYRKGALARRLFVAFGLNSPTLEKHTVEKYLEALGAWGVPPAPASLSLVELRDGRGSSTEKAPRRVLVIQSAFLGDSLLTLPLLREIKSIHPGSRLTVLTLPAHADLFRNCDWADEVIEDDKRGVHGGVLGPWKLSRRLAGEGFDLALIPHRSLRSALLAYMAGIPRRIGFTESAGRFLFTRVVSFSWLMHDLERNLALLLPLKAGLELKPDAERTLSADPAALAKVSALLESSGVAPKDILIGVHPGSKWPTKRWLPERFAEICRSLGTSGRKVLLIGSGEDAVLCANIARDSGALNLSGRTNLGELKALMTRMSLFITNDSGPMHVATASGVPTLALFGPTTRELGFFPFGQRHKVLEAELACRPCSLHGGKECPRGHFLCMKLITPADVHRQAEALLA